MSSPHPILLRRPRAAPATTTGIPSTDTSALLIAAYVYDGMGRRIQQLTVSGSSLATRDFYFSGQQDVQEAVGGSAATTYYWSPVYVDALIARDQDSARVYATTDATFNVTALVDTSGSVAERFDFDPYGQRTVLNADFVAQTGESQNWVVGYQGLIEDTSTGLLYNRARWYNVPLMRFNNLDPAHADGLNWYASRADNPINRRDWTGLEWGSNWGSNNTVFTNDPNSIATSHFRLIDKPMFNINGDVNFDIDIQGLPGPGEYAQVITILSWKDGKKLPTDRVIDYVSVNNITHYGDHQSAPTLGAQSSYAEQRFLLEFKLSSSAGAPTPGFNKGLGNLAYEGNTFTASLEPEGYPVGKHPNTTSGSGVAATLVGAYWWGFVWKRCGNTVGEMVQMMGVDSVTRTRLPERYGRYAVDTGYLRFDQDAEGSKLPAIWPDNVESSQIMTTALSRSIAGS